MVVGAVTMAFSTGCEGGLCPLCIGAFVPAAPPCSVRMRCSSAAGSTAGCPMVVGAVTMAFGTGPGARDRPLGLGAIPL